MTLKHPGGDAFTVAYPPPDWHFMDFWGNGHSFVHRCGLRLIIDCEEKDDGRHWVHISVSRKKFDPSHLDMVKVKHDFIGRERYAYAVYPTGDNYVNIHAHCLHLWALAEGADGRVLPEFSGVLALGATAFRSI